MRFVWNANRIEPDDKESRRSCSVIGKTGKWGHADISEQLFQKTVTRNTFACWSSLSVSETFQEASANMAAERETQKDEMFSFSASRSSQAYSPSLLSCAGFHIESLLSHYCVCMQYACFFRFCFCFWLLCSFFFLKFSVDFFVRPSAVSVCLQLALVVRLVNQSLTTSNTIKIIQDVQTKQKTTKRRNWTRCWW